MPPKNKKYIVVGYIRVPPENPIPLSLEEAKDDLAQMEFLQPENIYRIEEYNEEA